MSNDYPSITLSRIEEVQVNYKAGLVKVSFETSMSPADVARLINFAREREPLTCMITSPQARMDLRVEEVNLRTGEVTR